MRLPVLVSAVAGALVFVWVVAAVAMANRGFDTTDEGFYVLSYRWWRSTPRTFTGAQFIYGPIFELFDYSIPALRVVRLITVLVAHGVFAWAFVTWCAVRWPRLLPSGSWSWAAGLTITATGGVSYGWLPLSPGYNDLAALTSLGLAAAVLRVLRGLSLGGALPPLPAVFIGPLAVALALSRWASAVCLLPLFAAVLVVALMGRDAGGRRRCGAVLALSTGVSVLLTNVLVGGLGGYLDEQADVSRLVSGSTHSPAELVHLYLTSGSELVGRAGLVAGICALVVGLGRLVHSRLPSIGTTLVVVSPVVALIAVRPRRLGLPEGGTDGVATYAAELVALALVVLVAAAVGRPVAARPWPGVRSLPPSRRADAAVIVLLVVLPVAQVLGSGNAVSFLAVNLFACWTALMVALVAAVSRSSSSAARGLAVVATACAVIIAVEVGVSGLLAHPYRTSSFSASEVDPGGPGPLAGIRLSAAEAERLRALRAAVPGPREPGRPVMAFDEMAGLVLALDGRSVGEAWYTAGDGRRSTAGIVDACRRGRLDTAPIMLFNRAPTDVERSALRRCGFDLGRDFVARTVPGFEPELVVYNPTPAAVSRTVG